jgi:hypothetical protein
MTSYSEILYLIAAMVVFSFLSLNTAKSFNNSRQTLYIAEAESRAIAVAQDELDKVQWIYDPNDLNPNSASYVYANYPIIETQSYGNNDQYTSTFIISGTSDLIEDTGTMKRYQVVISVLNQQVTPDIFINLEYVKSYSY